jgi:tetratricopeptide (TPR) repeat protein
MESAMEFYEKSLEKFEQLNDIMRAAEVLLNKAMVYRKLGQVDQALEVFDKCSYIAKENAFASVLKICFLNKAEIYLDKKELELASKYSQNAIELCYHLNDRLSIAEVHKILGKIAKMQNNQSLAENYLLTSLRLNHELDQELNAAETDYELGLLYKGNGKKSEALTHLMNALKYFNKNNSKTISLEIETQMMGLNN